MCQTGPADPRQCLVPNDLENHDVCGAAPLVIQAMAACGTDCAQIDDIFCDDTDAWYRIEIDNKRLYKIKPDPDYLVDFQVFEPLIPSPQTIADLQQLPNPFSAAADMDKYFVVDGPSGATTEVYVRVRANAGDQNGTLTVWAYPETFDCVDPYLTDIGRQHYLPDGGAGIELSNYVGGLRDWNTVTDHVRQPFSPGSGTVNVEACRKTYVDDNDPSLGFATMEVVRCVDGVLETVYDCKSDFPNWDAAKEAAFGEVYCDTSSHPAGQLWCVPIRDGGDYRGLCELLEVTDGQVMCLTDPLTADSDYLFGCTTNAGYVFDQDPSLYNPEGITEDGYHVSVDCTDADLLGLTAQEAASAACGTNPLKGREECLNSRQQAAAAEVTDPASYPTDPAHFNFPTTQNFVACVPPGEGNELPYIKLDTLSGLYTDHHVAMVQDAIATWASRGIGYMGYLNVWGPEGHTEWGDAPGSNGGPWSTVPYQYLYWSEKLGADIGDPQGDYAPFERGCFDADEDGVGNDTDNCPRTFNPASGGVQPDADNDGIGDACDPDGVSEGDPDGDGADASWDNCPLVANADQADSDNNGIGDACQTTADTEFTTVSITCDPAKGAACVEPDGTVKPGGDPMRWAFDISQPRARDLLVAWTKLAALAGARGMTYDVAFMADCYSDDVVTQFRTFAQNGGGLSHDYLSDPDPNAAARVRAYWAMAEEHGGDQASDTHPDWASFDIRAVRLSMGETNFSGSATGRMWELFKYEMTVAFMKRVRSEMADFMAANFPGERFATFFNQGPSNLYGWERSDNGQTVTYSALKDLGGAETFIYSGHPLSGASDCIGVAGEYYPANQTAEMYFDLHDVDGARFWSWNFPESLPDDRMILFGAEALAAGGIYQAPYCSVEEHYPLGGYDRPNYTMRLAQAPLAPFVSRQWDKLNLPRATGQVALLWPQSVASGCQPGAQPEGRAAESLYRALRGLHYTVDVLGRGPFAAGRADLPTAAELAAYDFVTLAHPNLSDEEITILEQYVSDGGKLVVLGNPGGMTEWCEGATGRSGWFARFAGFGEHPSGGGAFYQLDGTTTAPEQVALVTNGTSYAAFDAFEYAEGPNASVRLCDNDPLVEADLPAARGQLVAWLGDTLGTFGLPAARVTTTMGSDVHVVERVGTSGPVYHLVNYGLDAVQYDNYHDGDLAGPNNYTDRTAYFGCVRAETGDLTVPVPPALQATGGTLRVVSLDYEAPQESFFPFTDQPASPCHQPALAGAYPSPDNDFAYPEVQASFPAGASEVTVPNVALKQWAIAWFE